MEINSNSLRMGLIIMWLCGICNIQLGTLKYLIRVNVKIHNFLTASLFSKKFKKPSRDTRTSRGEAMSSYEAPTRLEGCRTGVRCCCPCVGAVSELFFFFPGFAFTRLDLHRTGLIRPELACISQIGLYQPVTETAKRG